MYCGLCVEACPYEAIQAGGTFEDAVYEFDDHVPATSTR